MWPTALNLVWPQTSHSFAWQGKVGDASIPDIGIIEGRGRILLGRGLEIIEVILYIPVIREPSSAWAGWTVTFGSCK